MCVCVCVCVCVSTQLCPTLCDLLDCDLPGSSLHGISQARILEWVAISYSKREGWVRVPVWHRPEGSLACQGGSSHLAPASPANPISYAPSPSPPHPLPTTLAITENAKSFCPSSLLTQTHLGFICLDFPFPFLRNHQSPAHLFYHKEGWGERASSESSWEELVRKTVDPAPR